MKSPPVRAWILCLAAAGTFGCATAASPRTVPAVAEASVRPGINAPYVQPDALDKFTRVLEAETREVAQHRDEIVDAIGLRRGMVVADIGAGTGLFVTEIAKRVGKRGAVFAVDIVPVFLERITRTGLRRPRVHVRHLPPHRVPADLHAFALPHPAS
ncbi:MAG: hypothetical protein JRG70_20310 [Deltaproteobacteria bacterium]|nr:hypothetical protein [Deltaproteobacteria bacterium]